jgi:hypothetical protein
MKPNEAEPEDTRDESEIVLRVSRTRKSAYVRAAQRREKKPRTLAAWCFEHLDKASGYEEDAK